MKRFKPSRYLSTRSILLIVCVMVFVHLVALAVYTQQHKSTQHTARRDAGIQQVMNIIHMMQATPPGQLKKALEAIHEPNIEVKLNDKPLWPLRLSEFSYWRINSMVPQNAQDIQLSLHLMTGKWLNINVQILSPTLWPQLFLLCLEFLIVIIILFYAWSISRFTKPLKEFQHAARRLGVDMKPMQLEEYEGPSIVRETAQAMNQMQQRIRDLLHDRTLMIAAISHDLRTPITRLKLRANKIADPILKKKTDRDLDEMESMIAEILDFANHQSDAEKKIKFDVKSLVELICDDMNDMGLDVTVSTQKGRLIYHGRKMILQRAITNIVHNGVKYGHKVQVVCKNEHGKIKIIVDDEGPGIPEDELNKVFAPFYRCDRSRSRAIAGTGLGLAVARDAICGHNGSIELKNRPKGGLRAVIVLS
jgi:signal transduction histidine kinase